MFSRNGNLTLPNWLTSVLRRILSIGKCLISLKTLRMLKIYNKLCDVNTFTSRMSTWKSQQNRAFHVSAPSAQARCSKVPTLSITNSWRSELWTLSLSHRGSTSKRTTSNATIRIKWIATGLNFLRQWSVSPTVNTSNQASHRQYPKHLRCW